MTVLDTGTPERVARRAHLRGAPVAHIVRAVARDDVETCGRLRAAVYVSEKGWLPADAASNGCEWDGDDARAVPLLVRGPDDQPVATMRVLLPADEPLPVERFAGVRPDPGRRGVECSRLIVAQDWRGGAGNVLLALSRAALDVAVETGAREMWALVEPPLLAYLQWFGFPFQPVGPVVHAYETDNVAVVLPLERLWRGLTRHERMHHCAIVDFFSSNCRDEAPLGEMCGLP